MVGAQRSILNFGSFFLRLLVHNFIHFIITLLLLLIHMVGKCYMYLKLVDILSASVFTLDD